MHVMTLINHLWHRPTLKFMGILGVISPAVLQVQKRYLKILNVYKFMKHKTVGVLDRLTNMQAGILLGPGIIYKDLL